MYKFKVYLKSVCIKKNLPSLIKLIELLTTNLLKYGLKYLEH